MYWCYANKTIEILAWKRKKILCITRMEFDMIQASYVLLCITLLICKYNSSHQSTLKFQIIVKGPILPREWKKFQCLITYNCTRWKISLTFIGFYKIADRYLILKVCKAVETGIILSIVDNIYVFWKKVHDLIVVPIVLQVQIRELIKNSLWYTKIRDLCLFHKHYSCHRLDLSIRLYMFL